jgi:hypothetical protein
MISEEDIIIKRITEGRNMNSIKKLGFCIIFLFIMITSVLGEINKDECAKAKFDIYKYTEALDFSNMVYYTQKEEAKKYANLCERAIKQIVKLLDQPVQDTRGLNNLEKLVVPCNNISKLVIELEEERRFREKTFLKRKEAYTRQEYFCEGREEL